jgi:hypothetical protein
VQGVSLSTASSMDLQGVSISTANSMNMQGVYHTIFSYPPTFQAIGCGSGVLTVLVGRSSLPLPPWVTRRGAVWRGASHSLQHGHVTPPTSYLGSGEGDSQQQQQQQYFNPLPSARPASSIPLLLPPFCIRCSVHVWQGA